MKLKLKKRFKGFLKEKKRMYKEEREFKKKVFAVKKEAFRDETLKQAKFAGARLGKGTFKPKKKRPLCDIYAGMPD